MWGALIGAVGIWAALGAIVLFAWIADRHTWLLWVLLLTATGAIFGYAISEDFY